MKLSLRVTAMASPAVCFPSSSTLFCNSSLTTFHKLSPFFSSQTPIHLTPIKPTNHHLFLRSPTPTRIRSTLGEKDATVPLLVQEEEDEQQPNEEVKACVKVLKEAAKTRRVSSEDILSALSVIEKAKLNPSTFFETLGGSKSPGRTWMLVYTAQKQLKGGKYFPITAVQRFDAAGKRIENGVYLGPLGSLTFEGRLSWKNRILAFIFECVRIKVGPFNPLEISFKGEDKDEPSTKNPFFIWFYVDEEIAVARGKSGGTAFWCRCQRAIS